MPEWLIIILSLISGVCGGVGGAMRGSRMAEAQMQAHFRKLAELENRLENNHEKRLEKLEGFREHHNTNCPSQGIKHDLDNALGWLKRIDSKLDMYSAQTAKQDAAIAGQGKWLENLDGAVQSHTRDRGIHHG